MAETKQQDENILESPPTQDIIYFADGNLEYIYDFNLIKIIQSENAKEIGEFKHYQMMKEANNIKELVQSRANEWMIICLSYLLVPFVNGSPQPFSEAKIGDTERFVKNLSASELPKMEECVKHFFTAIGKKEMILQILQGKGKQLWKQMLLGTALNSMNKS